MPGAMTKKNVRLFGLAIAQAIGQLGSLATGRWTIFIQANQKFFPAMAPMTSWARYPLIFPLPDSKRSPLGHGQPYRRQSAGSQEPSGRFLGLASWALEEFPKALSAEFRKSLSACEELMVENFAAFWPIRVKELAAGLEDHHQPCRAMRALDQYLLYIGGPAGAADDARERGLREPSLLAGIGEHGFQVRNQLRDVGNNNVAWRNHRSPRPPQSEVTKIDPVCAISASAKVIVACEISSGPPWLDHRMGRSVRDISIMLRSVGSSWTKISPAGKDCNT